MPDIFIPLDTMQLNEYFLRLRPHVPQFVFRYLENEISVKEYNSLADFDRKFTVDDQMLTAFLNYAEEKGVKKSKVSLAQTQELIERLLKARVARKYFGEKGHFYIWNSNDPVVRAAVIRLKAPNPLSAFKNEN